MAVRQIIAKADLIKNAKDKCSPQVSSKIQLIETPHKTETSQIEKMLNTKYLHGFHNDTLAKNNSINSHSNEL